MLRLANANRTRQTKIDQGQTIEYTNLAVLTGDHIDDGFFTRKRMVV